MLVIRQTMNELATGYWLPIWSLRKASHWRWFSPSFQFLECGLKNRPNMAALRHVFTSHRIFSKLLRSFHFLSIWIEINRCVIRLIPRPWTCRTSQNQQFLNERQQTTWSSSRHYWLHMIWYIFQFSSEFYFQFVPISRLNP